MFKSKQFFSFLVTGGIAALANFGSRFAFNRYFSFELSVVFAYLVGMVSAFVLAKYFVFEKSQHSTRKEFFYFTLVNVAAIIQTYVISVGCAKYLFPKLQMIFYPEAIAHALGIAFPVFTSFIGHKKLSFKEKNEA